MGSAQHNATCLTLLKSYRQCVLCFSRQVSQDVSMAEASSSSSSGAPKTKQPHLSVQDLSALNVADLTPLTPEVISRQATINIGAF